MKAFLDFIPLLAFFIVAKTHGILKAAGALLVATLIIYVIHFIRQKGKLDKQQWVILLFTIGFCGLTLLLNDDLYLRWKSPIINAVFALALLVSLTFKKPLMQLAFKEVFELSRSGWQKLTFAWAVFFAGMAALHFVFAFIYPQWWVDFKTYGWIPFMVVFMLGQFIMLKDHIKHPIENAKS